MSIELEKTGGISLDLDAARPTAEELLGMSVQQSVDSNATDEQVYLRAEHDRLTGVLAGLPADATRKARDTARRHVGAVERALRKLDEKNPRAHDEEQYQRALDRHFLWRCDSRNPRIPTPPEPSRYRAPVVPTAVWPDGVERRLDRGEACPDGATVELRVIGRWRGQGGG